MTVRQRSTRSDTKSGLIPHATIHPAQVVDTLDEAEPWS